VFANMRRVGKGFSGVETPLFESMLAVRDVPEESEAQDEGIELVVDQEKDVEVERRHADKQAEIYNIDLDHSSKVLSMQEDDTEVQEVVETPLFETMLAVRDVAEDVEAQDEGIELVIDQEKDAEFEGRHADKQTEIYNNDLDHSSKVLSMQEDDTEVQEAVEIVTTAKLMTEVVTAAATQVEMDAEYAKKLQEELDKEQEEAYKHIDWNAALDHVQSKEPQYIKRYHGIKKKPQTESEARKNMISYLKNTKGYKMEFFKGKTFTTLLKNFDREDLETLWRIVRDGFSTSKPTNFSDEYLLLTLKTMFGELDEQDPIWRMALVKRWKLLTSCGVHVIILSTV
nr:hypothetical protein [Tanacetum cinerariifolium]